jgi:hypothetical protein
MSARVRAIIARRALRPLLLSRLWAIQERLNMSEGGGVSIRHRRPLLGGQIRGQYIGQCIDGDSNSHGFRIGELGAIDGNFCFVFHANMPFPTPYNGLEG